MPPIDQTSGGPDGGHCLSRPLSVDRFVRLGPCHCGQSVDEAACCAPVAVVTPMIRISEINERRTFTVTPVFCFAVRRSYVDNRSPERLALPASLGVPLLGSFQPIALS